MFRPTLLLALALQLFAALAPANAVVICVSSDGCVELETAPPGYTRCLEDECDPGHEDAAHGCRDIPVLVDAVGLRGAPSLDGCGMAFAALVPARHARVATATAAPRRATVAAPDRPAPPRSIVLQL
ncbi:hypothetical protein KF840_17835 [bacterium]|nr:hypothetical protein [bacterium]